jgi:hypothetical protein
MWPWNGKKGADPRFPDDPDAMRPNDAPGGPFPPATPFQLGPPAKPRPLDLIDYLGLKDSKTAIGVCYDKIPYAPAKAPPKPIALRTAASRTALARFLDAKQPLDNRLSAVRAARSPGAEQVKDVMQIVLDPKADARLRIQALALVHSPDDEPHARELIALAGNRKTPAELRRRVAFRLGFLLDFSSAGLVSRADYLAALRDLLADPDQQIRDHAISRLVAHGDQTVVRRLIQGLNNPARELQPPAHALRSLTHASHADGYEVFRKYYEGSADPTTRMAAARGLARFEKGRAILRADLLNAEESAALRLATLQALNANDAAQLPAYAVKVVQDTKSDPELRSFALSALTYQVAAVRHRKGQPAAYKPTEITSRIRQLAVTAKQPTLRMQAWQFLELNDPHFLQVAPNLLRQEQDEKIKPILQGILLREQRNAIDAARRSRR